MSDNNDNYDEDDSSERGPLPRLERYSAPASRRRFLSGTAKVGGGAFALSAVGTGVVGGNEDEHEDEHEGEDRDDDDDGEAGAVFVMTNDPDRNQIVAFARAADGTLTEADTFDTGGTGSGSFEDTSTGLVLGSARGESSPNNLIEDHELLFAVNPGSNTITVFEVEGTDLDFVDLQDSNGEKPVSVTVNDGLLYVLNSGETVDEFNPPNCVQGKDPKITGFEVSDEGRLTAIPGSTRPLSGDDRSGCAQVSFTPDGKQLVATERLAETKNQEADSDIPLLDEEGVINVYEVNDDGTVTGPVVNEPTGQGPFGFTYTKEADGGELLTTEQFDIEPGQGAVASYEVNSDGTLTPLSGSVHNGGTDTCWIVVTDDGQYAYTTSFFADGRISTYEIADDGGLTLLEGEEAFIGQGASDISPSLDSRYFYARNSFDGTVTGFRVGDDGSLTKIQTVSGTPPSDVAARVYLAAY